jgi:hypothetical protein
MRRLSVERSTRRCKRVGKGCARRSSGRDGHARRPALEQCEDRILQGVAVGPARAKYNDNAIKTALPQETAFTPDGSLSVVPSKARFDQASGIFDEPFFFDVNQA